LSIFDDANINFKNNNYLRSIELFENAIKNEDLALEDQSFAWDKIRLIHKKLNKKINLSALREMLGVYRDIKSHQKSYEVLCELYRETNELFYLNEIYRNTILNGDIKEASCVAKNYVEKLIKEKRADEIIEFISENERKLDVTQVILWKVNAFLISGDRSSFLSLYEDVEKLGYQDLIIQEYVRVAAKKTHFWQSESRIIKILLKQFSECNKLISVSSKQLAKLILDAWMENNIDNDLIITTVTIAKRYRLNIVGAAIAQYMDDEKLERRFKKNAPSDLMYLDIDLGEDLFARENIESENKESKIIRNIELLNSLGKQEEIKIELNKLKKISPGHKLLASKSTSETFDSDELFNDLMSEFSIYRASSEESNVEDGYKNIANYYDWEYLQENYEDMIIGFNLLTLYDVALDIIGMVNRELLSENEIINLEYLRLETYMKSQSFFNVKDGVDDVINNFPIKGSELLSLLYLRAEAFRGLKQFKSAYYAFDEINKIKKGYRNTIKRLRELEKHK